MPPTVTYLRYRSFIFLRTGLSKGVSVFTCVPISDVLSWLKPSAQRNSSKSMGSMCTTSTYPTGVSLSTHSVFPSWDPEHMMSHLPSIERGLRADTASSQACISSRNRRHPSNDSMPSSR